MLDGLNKEQIKAVKNIDGPMLVMAGAGSGKTKVLTTRIAYMIDRGIDPYNILAITFTNKAANEMKERIIKLIGDKARMMQISTFHSFGLTIIKKYFEYIIIDTGAGINSHVFDIVEQSNLILLLLSIYQY